MPMLAKVAILLAALVRPFGDRWFETRPRENRACGCAHSVVMDSFGGSPFGMPSPDLSTNVGYLQQAQTFAAINPGNLQAQRRAAYWQEVVQRQSAAQAGAP